MRTAQLIETLDAGGAEALAVEIANTLARRGFESHLIVVSGGGVFQSRIDDAVQVHDLASPRCTGNLLARAWYFATTNLRLLRLVRTKRIEVMQSHLPKANFFGLVLSILTSIRVHPTVHNNKEFDYGVKTSPLFEKGRRVAYERMLRHGGKMIAVSEEVKTAMIDELGIAGSTREQRIVAVPNGVACGVARTSEEKSDLRRQWGVDGDTVLLVGAGRLTRQKNFASLIRCLAALPEDLAPWQCVVAGDGELRDDLAAQIAACGLQDRIALPGHVPALRDLMAAADVFCLSSIFEGLPLVMLEAMAAGLPICSFGINGVVDVVAHEKESLLARPGEDEDLTRMLERLIRDRSLRRQLGEAGRRLVREQYTFDGMVDTLVGLYESR